MLVLISNLVAYLASTITHLACVQPVALLAIAVVQLHLFTYATRPYAQPTATSSHL